MIKYDFRLLASHNTVVARIKEIENLKFGFGDQQSTIYRPEVNVDTNLDLDCKLDGKVKGRINDQPAFFDHIKHNRYVVDG
jgi:hypothetical protein